MALTAEQKSTILKQRDKALTAPDGPGPYKEMSVDLNDGIRAGIDVFEQPDGTCGYNRWIEADDDNGRRWRHTETDKGLYSKGWSRLT